MAVCLIDFTSGVTGEMDPNIIPKPAVPIKRKGVRWVKPALAAEVEFGDGRVAASCGTPRTRACARKDRWRVHNQVRAAKTRTYRFCGRQGDRIND